MNKEIPSKVVRKIIFDILQERSNKLDEECEKLEHQKLKECNVALDYSQSIGCEACGTRVLADEVLLGQISIEEAIKDILKRDEIKEAKTRCEDWIKEKYLLENETER